MIIEDPVYNAYQTSCNTVRAEGVLTQLLRIKIHDLDEAITMLHSNGLIVDNFMGRSLQTNGNVVHVLDNMLTVRGKDFVKFLK